MSCIHNKRVVAGTVLPLTSMTYYLLAVNFILQFPCMALIVWIQMLEWSLNACMIIRKPRETLSYGGRAGLDGGKDMI